MCPRRQSERVMRKSKCQRGHEPRWPNSEQWPAVSPCFELISIWTTGRETQVNKAADDNSFSSFVTWNILAPPFLTVLSSRTQTGASLNYWQCKLICLTRQDKKESGDCFGNEFFILRPRKEAYNSAMPRSALMDAKGGRARHRNDIRNYFFFDYTENFRYKVK